MASSHENVSMAVFCDFENVALGVRDAKYDKFDIKPILERLLLKGSIVIKKAYCDWDRYKSFKSTMHEANFELIEIPHIRQSGKNSADIRLVVDALDLCYTKSHVNTFVIISGDSDFSPLVSKLRENAKQVIGVGVKQSTSDLLIANCDEFIFYDDLVRESQRAAKRDTEEVQPEARRSPDEEKHRKEELEARKSRAIEITVETFDALVSERGDSGKIWASALKQAIKRRKPDFNESYFGFRAFGNLLDEAQLRGLLELGRDEKSGTYVYRSSGGTDPGKAMEQAPDVPVATVEAEGEAEAGVTPSEVVETRGKQEAAHKKRGGRKPVEKKAKTGAPKTTGRPLLPEAANVPDGPDLAASPAAPGVTASLAGPDSTASSAKSGAADAPVPDAAPAAQVSAEPAAQATPKAAARAPRKPAAPTRRRRKPVVAPDSTT